MENNLKLKGEWFIILSLIIIVSCKSKNNSEYVIFNKNSADSIQIFNMKYYNEIAHVYFYKKNIIYTLNEQNSELRFYYAKDLSLTNFDFKKSFQICSTKQYFNYVNRLNHDIYVIDYDGIVYNYNILTNKVIIKDTFIVKNKINNIKYNYLSQNSYPIYYYPDSLFVSVFNYPDANSYEKYMMENRIDLIRIKNKIKNYNKIQKSFTNLYKNYDPFIMYTFNNNIVAVYPNFDTIYSTNINSMLLSKIELLNKDYVKPQKFNVTNRNNNAYVTNYNLKNFRYISFYYLPTIESYILFYTIPVSKSNPNYGDQDYYYITLNKDLRITNYHYLQKIFYHPDCALIKSESKIYLPVLKNEFNDKKPLLFYSIN